jgi:hypothetical protein
MIIKEEKKKNGTKLPPSKTVLKTCSVGFLNFFFLGVGDEKVKKN